MRYFLLMLNASAENRDWGEGCIGSRSSSPSSSSSSSSSKGPLFTALQGLSAPRPVSQAITCTLLYFSCCDSDRTVVESLLHCGSGRTLLAASVNQDSYDALLQLCIDHCFTTALEEIYSGEAWTQCPASLRLKKDHCFTTTLKEI